jgi:cytochrome P450
MSIKKRVYRTASSLVLGFLRQLDAWFNGSVSGLDIEQLRINPYAGYTLLRERGPVLRSYANRGWFILGFEQVQAVFKDPRFGSDLRKNKFLVNIFRATADGKPVPALDEPSMLNLDAPDHTRLRKLVSRGFLHKYIQSLEPNIKAIVERCLDGVDHQQTSFDILDALARPLPAIVIAEMLGLPESDRDQFQRWSDDLLGLSNIEDPDLMEQAMVSNVALIDYLAAIVELKRLNPGKDFLSELIAIEEVGDRLTVEEVYSTCVLLLTAGHETTTRLISNGLYLLLTHPQQMALLQKDRSLLPNAIEEMLRYEPPVQFMPRFATQDIEFNGKQIKKNQLLLVMIASANRDANANTDPDRFDVTRKNIQHVSFGYGIHLCLGLTLARLEARIAFEVLLDRFPQLALAEQDIQWTSSNPFVRGIERLMVSSGGV